MGWRKSKIRAGGTQMSSYQSIGYYSWYFFALSKVLLLGKSRQGIAPLST